MSERLPESPRLERTPERAPQSTEISQETQRIAEGVEALDVRGPEEQAPTTAGEQWSQTGGSQQTTGTTSATVPQDTRIVLPSSVGEMQKLVRTEIKAQMRTLLQDAKRQSSSGQFSAHQMNNTVSKMRRLQDLLRKLLEFSRDKLKEILFSIVPSSRYVDPEEEQR